MIQLNNEAVELAAEELETTVGGGLGSFLAAAWSAAGGAPVGRSGGAIEVQDYGFSISMPVTTG